MKPPAIDDGDIRIWHGDALTTLRQMPSESVHMAITSPPFWGLRDYGTGNWTGGDDTCDHGPTGSPQRDTSGGFSDSPTRVSVDHGTRGNQGSAAAGAKPQLAVCSRCGARRIDQQIGLEPTPSCGTQGLMRLRSDLTAEQREYVARRLVEEANRDA